MTPLSEQLFDPDVLPNALETHDNVTLASFYEMFVDFTSEVLREIDLDGPELDFEQIKNVAQKLQSSSAAIGAPAMVAALIKLESLAALRKSHEARSAFEDTVKTLRSTVEVVKARLGELID